MIELFRLCFLNFLNVAKLFKNGGLGFVYLQWCAGGPLDWVGTAQAGTSPMWGRMIDIFRSGTNCQPFIWQLFIPAILTKSWCYHMHYVFRQLTMMCHCFVCLFAFPCSVEKFSIFLYVHLVILISLLWIAIFFSWVFLYFLFVEFIFFQKTNPLWFVGSYALQ